MTFKELISNAGIPKKKRDKKYHICEIGTGYLTEKAIGSFDNEEKAFKEFQIIEKEFKTNLFTFLVMIEEYI